MITKRAEFGKIEILPDGVIQLREDTIIEEDGIELSRTYHRSVLEPSTEKAHPNARVAAVAAALWTPDVVQAFEDKKKDAEAAVAALVASATKVAPTAKTK